MIRCRVCSSPIELHIDLDRWQHAMPDLTGLDAWSAGLVLGNWTLRTRHEAQPCVKDVLRGFHDPHWAENASVAFDEGRWTEMYERAGRR